jgi:photosystem I subunit X
VFYSTLLLATATPLSQEWSITVAIVMVAANILGVLAATRSKKAGPALPGGALTIAQLVGGTCFGHVLGAGAILGLTSYGVI